MVMELVPWAWLTLVIAGAIFLVAQFRLAKIKKRDSARSLAGLTAVVAGAFLVLVSIGAVGDDGLSVGDIDVGNDNDAGEVLLACDGIATVSTTINDKNVEKPGTNPGVTSAYVYEGSPTGNQTVNAGINMKPLTSQEVLVGYEGTTYYPRPLSFTTSCSAEEIQADLAQSGALTVQVKNEDDGQPNSNSDAQVLGANEEIEMEFTMDTTTDRYWGAIDESGSAVDCNVIVASYDKTYFDDVEIVGARSVAVPNNFAAFNASYDGEKAYEVEGVVDGDRIDQIVRIDTDNSNNPDESTGPLRLHFFDCSYDIDADTEDLFSGVEDESDNALYQQPLNATIEFS